MPGRSGGLYIHGHQVFRESRDTDQHYPKLKEKGPQVKRVVAPLMRVWEQCHDPTNAEHVLNLRMVELLDRLQGLIHGSAQDAFISRKDADHL